MCHILSFLSFEILQSKRSTGMWNIAVIKGKCQWRPPRHPALQKTNQNLYGMLPSWHADEKTQLHSSYLKAQKAVGLQHSCKGSELSCKTENLHRWNAKNGCFNCLFMLNIVFHNCLPRIVTSERINRTATCLYCIFFNTRHGKHGKHGKSANLCCSLDISQDWGCLFLPQRLKKWGPRAECTRIPFPCTSEA